jgi:hypothetical protein
MGMSERLYQEMMKVPSNRIRPLSYNETEAFNLSGEDPGYSEWRRARNVAKHGEAKMKEFDAWLIRQKDFVARCMGSSSGVELSLRCDKEFQSKFPNPLFR